MKQILLLLKCYLPWSHRLFAFGWFLIISADYIDQRKENPLRWFKKFFQHKNAKG